MRAAEVAIVFVRIYVSPIMPPENHTVVNVGSKLSESFVMSAGITQDEELIVSEDNQAAQSTL